jgi:hypothetical protein
MEFPQPKLVRQTNEHRPPDLSPAEAAVISAEQWAFHYAHVKRIEEQKAKEARELDDKDKTQGCWLRRATEKLDAKSVAILRKSYADMFECEEPQWKVNMDKHIAKAQELEDDKQRGKAQELEDDKDDA